MSLPRRFLPPTSLLSAFEAAARYESFTLAARELNLTQSAVSRQIRALEDALGSALFHREKQKVTLTLAGENYARAVRDALRRISSATLEFRANPAGGSLNLAILPTFGARWLAPRLPSFLASCPGVVVNLTTRLEPFDFNQDGADAAIHFGLPDWPGAEHVFLMHEVVVPVCSPALRDRYSFNSPSDLVEAPLLHLASRPDAWERWMAAMGADTASVHGMLLDQMTTSAEAAMAGLGIALLPEFLIEQEFESGALVRAYDGAVSSSEAYYFVLPSARADHWPMSVFRDWLSTTAAAYRAGG